MQNRPFVQRKKRVPLQRPENSRPTSLARLPFLGHALLGGIYCVYFDDYSANPNRIANDGLYDFELSTLTLSKGFSRLPYSIENGVVTLGTPTPPVTTPIVFPLLVNLLPSDRVYPFVPDCWHECEEDKKWAGKYGCPLLVTDFDENFIVLTYEGEREVYQDSAFVPLIFPNQQLVYYRFPVSDVAAKISEWHEKVGVHRNIGNNNFSAAADMEILFNDGLQISYCNEVNIPLPESPEIPESTQIPEA